MNIQVIEAKDPQYKKVFSNLVELYLYELSADLEFDVNEKGLYGDEDVNDCWQENYRNPFIMKIDGKLAGFAIVDEIKHLDGKFGFDIGEFFILKKYSGKGLGKDFAFRLFDHFKGSWQVKELEENISAISFWRKIISEYTKENFKEVFWDDVDWKGPVQYFSN